MAFQSSRKQEFFARELIGKKLKVTSSSCKDLQKVVGKIVDETVNTFVVENGGKKRVIPKNSCVFQIEGHAINGVELIGRPEDRTKKFLKF